MTPFGAAIVAAVLLAIGGAAAWYLLITTEGVYLGRRVVIWLYDLYARRYDRIKKYDAEWEALMLAQPILAALQGIKRPLILDVATGTARLPLTLIGEPTFGGHVVGLDLSRRMLAVAAEKLAACPGGARASLIWQAAEALPFPDATFDAVTCLEALEFTADQDAVIAELVRVTRPGGLLLLTNRKGEGARLMPGKTQPGEAMAAHLRERFGLVEVTLRIWQVDYEQVWARRPTQSGTTVPQPESALAADGCFTIEAILRCPRCGAVAFIAVQSGALLCTVCEGRVPVAPDGVILLAGVSQGGA